jgi:hypothetical protein
MNVFIAKLSEVLGTEVALERFDVVMDQKMVLEAALSRKSLAAAFEFA